MRRPNARRPPYAATPARMALALIALLAAAACSGGAATPEATSTPAPPPGALERALTLRAAAPAATPEAAAAPEASPTPDARSGLELIEPAPGALERALTLRAAAPAATPEAAAAPEASPTPDARSGLELIEPAPGAFVHRTFGDGEALDWAHGIFVLDVETGLTEGYALAGVEPGFHDGIPYWEHGGVWIGADRRGAGSHWLLDRESGRSWRWQRGPLSLEAVTEEHLLFREGGGRERGGRFFLANRQMEEVFSFPIDPPGAALFSPDGHALAIAMAHEVYLVPLPSGTPTLLFEADPDASPDVLFSPDGSAVVIATAHEVYLIPLPSGTPTLLFEAERDGGTPRTWIRNSSSGIAVESWYGERNNEVEVEKLHFGWDGARACPGTLSPDGRYAAVQEGGPYFAGKAFIPPLENPGRRSSSWTPIPAPRSSECDRPTGRSGGNRPTCRSRGNTIGRRDGCRRVRESSSACVAGTRSRASVRRRRFEGCRGAPRTPLPLPRAAGAISDPARACTTPPKTAGTA